MKNYKNETPQIKFWRDKIGEAYTAKNIEKIPRHKIRQNFFNLFKDIPKTAKILEVGCNIGYNLKSLRDLGFSNLHGIDISPYAVEEANKTFPFLKVSEGSALELPFLDNSFDVIFTCGVLIHIHPNELKTVMKEINRCSSKYILGNECCNFDKIEPTNYGKYRGEDEVFFYANYFELYKRYLNISFKDEKFIKEHYPRTVVFDKVTFILTKK